MAEAFTLRTIHPVGQNRLSVLRGEALTLMAKHEMCQVPDVLNEYRKLRAAPDWRRAIVAICAIRFASCNMPHCILQNAARPPTILGRQVALPARLAL